MKKRGREKRVKGEIEERRGREKGGGGGKSGIL